MECIFVHWVAREKYRLIPHFASCNSKPSPPASLCQHGTPGGMVHSPPLYRYVITLFWRGRSVRLIRLEKRSLSVGKNFGLAKTLTLGKEQISMSNLRISYAYLMGSNALDSSTSYLFLRNTLAKFKKDWRNTLLAILIYVTWENCWNSSNKANLRDLIAATNLVILFKLDSNRWFFSLCDLEIWWMTIDKHESTSSILH